jgi:hypothetical protein
LQLKTVHLSICHERVKKCTFRKRTFFKLVLLDTEHIQLKKIDYPSLNWNNWSENRFTSHKKVKKEVSTTANATSLLGDNWLKIKLPMKHFLSFYLTFISISLKWDKVEVWNWMLPIYEMSIRFIILSIKWWKFNVRVSVGCMHMLVALHNKFSGYLNQFMFSFATNNLGLMCACKFCYCI